MATKCDKCDKEITGTVYHCLGCKNNYDYEYTDQKNGKMYCPDCGYEMG